MGNKVMWYDSQIHPSRSVAEITEFRRLFTQLLFSYRNQRRKMVYIKLISYWGTQFVILSRISVASQLSFNFCAKMMQVLRKGRLCTIVYTYVICVPV